jgi:hypothetical protein
MLLYFLTMSPCSNTTAHNSSHPARIGGRVEGPVGAAVASNDGVIGTAAVQASTSSRARVWQASGSR